MSSPFPKVMTKSASKRNRSQDSRRSLTPVPAKASVTLDTENIRVPAFLRQSKAGKLPISFAVLGVLN
jgi:hypothetical protein